jgi:hypothetical protein
VSASDTKNGCSNRFPITESYRWTKKLQLFRPLFAINSRGRNPDTVERSVDCGALPPIFLSIAKSRTTLRLGPGTSPHRLVTTDGPLGSSSGSEQREHVEAGGAKDNAERGADNNVAEEVHAKNDPRTGDEEGDRQQVSQQLRIKQSER